MSMLDAAKKSNLDANKLVDTSEMYGCDWLRNLCDDIEWSRKKTEEWINSRDYREKVETVTGKDKGYEDACIEFICKYLYLVGRLEDHPISYLKAYGNECILNEAWNCYKIGCLCNILATLTSRHESYDVQIELTDLKESIGDPKYIKSVVDYFISCLSNYKTYDGVDLLLTQFNNYFLCTAEEKATVLVQTAVETTARIVQNELGIDIAVRELDLSNLRYMRQYYGSNWSKILYEYVKPHVEKAEIWANSHHYEKKAAAVADNNQRWDVECIRYMCTYINRASRLKYRPDGRLGLYYDKWSLNEAWNCYRMKCLWVALSARSHPDYGWSINRFDTPHEGYGCPKDIKETVDYLWHCLKPYKKYDGVDSLLTQLDNYFLCTAKEKTTIVETAIDVVAKIIQGEFGIDAKYKQ